MIPRSSVRREHEGTDVPRPPGSGHVASQIRATSLYSARVAWPVGHHRADPRDAQISARSPRVRGLRAVAWGRPRQAPYRPTSPAPTRPWVPGDGDVLAMLPQVAVNLLGAADRLVRIFFTTDRADLREDRQLGESDRGMTMRLYRNSIESSPCSAGSAWTTGPAISIAGLIAVAAANGGATSQDEDGFRRGHARRQQIASSSEP